MGGLNVILGSLLGSHFGAKGVAFGYAGSLAVGSWLLIAIFHKLNAVSWGALFSREHSGLASASMFILAYSTFEVMMPVDDEKMRMVILLIFPILTLGVFVWFHPLRKPLLARVLSMPARWAAKCNERLNSC
jgi:hypothetical protein